MQGSETTRSGMLKQSQDDVDAVRTDLQRLQRLLEDAQRELTDLRTANAALLKEKSDRDAELAGLRKEYGKLENDYK